MGNVAIPIAPRAQGNDIGLAFNGLFCEHDAVVRAAELVGHLREELRDRLQLRQLFLNRSIAKRRRLHAKRKACMASPSSAKSAG